MQFGRLHGIALIVLGLILIGLQLQFALSSNSGVSTEPTAVSAPTHMPHFGPWAGILGGTSLIVGIIVFKTGRRRDEPEANHAVR
jgi:hypothetical protein